MNNKRATKRALLTSVMALVMCVVMLVGTTFAWFTDTASTAVNKIQAGNLDVQLLMRDADGAYVNIGDSQQVIFGGANSLVAQNNNQDTLWEPGKTQVAYLAVRNAGNLALKYNILLNVRDEGLIGALDYAIVPQSKLSGENQTCTDTIASWVDAKGRTGAESGKLTAGTFTAAPNGCLDEIAHDKTNTNETEYFALVVHMDENAGNTYMNKSVSIDMKVVATQAAAEFDSFNNQYDKDAPLDFEPVATADELKAAAAAGKNVQLTQDVTLAEALTFDNEVTIDLNGKTLTTGLNSNGYSLVTKENATIVNGTYKGTGSARGIGAYGNLNMRNVTVDVSGLVGVACSAADSQYTIEDSTIKGGYALCNFSNKATINVSNSTLEGKTVGLYHNGSNSGLNLTVTGTKINAGNNGTDATGVYISGSTATTTAGGYQKASFTDCTIKGNAAVEVKYTDLTLNNCTVIATVDSANASYTQNNNGSTTNGFAVVSTDNATNNTMPKPEGTITINGGSYTGLIGLHSFSEITTKFPGFVDTTYVIN
ncbi:MAG TPA: hypothetical protein DHW47_06655 [Oscillibacter sp.]|nr:hypothetical protein [Oscillibacter sp.]